jgi:NAD(P)-dependent dehydrogenase (short-subunit alcohol dehydrogenase family)
MALEFGRQGARVALSARRVAELEALAAAIISAGGQAKAFPCDILQESCIEACVRDVVAHFGRLDVAVANAGFGVIGRIEELSAADWQRQLAGNVTGLALTARYALPHLRATRGRLGLVGSVAAFLPGPKTGAYGASKAAVHSIGETLQLELRGSGVTCTTMHPGFVESNITRVDNSGHFDPSRPDVRPAKLMWPTDRAARVMVRALARRQAVFVFTGHGKLLAFLGRHFPRVARWLVGKVG